MCGVIYFKGNIGEFGPLLRALVRESRVRGLHAFGAAIKPLDEEEWMVGRYFTSEGVYDVISSHGGVCEFIGHTRYDTSGDWHMLGNNQPVQAGNDLMVFNGVVRMSLKKEYEKEFGTKYKTANDGEIPLKMMAEGDTQRTLALLSEPGVSFAGVFSVGNQSFALRNVRRPLWYYRTPAGATFVFSTQDIWCRAVVRATGLVPKSKPVEVPPMEVLWL